MRIHMAVLRKYEVSFCLDEDHALCVIQRIAGNDDPVSCRGKSPEAAYWGALRYAQERWPDTCNKCWMDSGVITIHRGPAMPAEFKRCGCEAGKSITDARLLQDR